MNNRNVFETYFVRNTNKKTIINANLVYHGLEKFGYISIYFFLFSILYYLFPLDFFVLPLSIILRLCFLVLIYFLISPIILRLLAYTILIYYKEKNIIKFGSDNDSINVLEIKNIEIVEEEFFNAEGNIYKLKFNLSGGEKTSSFAFTTFNQAKSLADVLMGTIQIDSKDS